MKKRIIQFLVLVSVVSSVFAGGQQEGEEAAVASTVAVERTVFAAETENSYSKVVNTIPSSFQEAPILTEMVNAGELPPLSERLPKDPLVIQPGYEIGQYGGTLHRAFKGPGDHQNIERIMKNHFLFWDIEVKEITPHIAKGYEVNSDFTEYTFFLREGMKWSDGSPYTADDYIFWYKDVLLNDDLVPGKFGWAQSNGEVGVWKKIDDYCFTVTFVDSYGLFPDLLASLTVNGHFTQLERNSGGVSPKHYMTQFHADYIGLEKAQALAKEEGFGSWTEMFSFKNDPNLNPECPVTTAWMPKNSFSDDQLVFERNPYYFAVDSEGNQLPYIDKIQMDLVQDLEILNMNAIAGEYDFQLRHIQLNNISLLLENQEKGGYSVFLPTSKGTISPAIHINQDYDKDMNIARYLRDRDFRNALSMGIDREQINEAFYSGLATPSSNVAWPDPPYSPGEEYSKLYIELDIEMANEMLDGMGLSKRDSNGYRVMENGETLRLELLVEGTTGAQDSEMIAEQWKRNLGILCDIKTTDRSHRYTLFEQNDFQMTTHVVGASQALFTFPTWNLPYDFSSAMAPLAGKWFQDHSTGREPTGPLKEMQELWVAGSKVGLEDRVEYGQAIRKIFAEENYAIGVLTNTQFWVGVRSNKLVNIPFEIPFTAVAQTPGNLFPEAWFYRD